MTELVLNVAGLTCFRYQHVRKRQLCFSQCPYRYNVPFKIKESKFGCRQSFQYSPARRTCDPLKASAGSIDPELPSDPGRDVVGRQDVFRKGTVPVKLLALVGLVLITGVSNRVLYKMALVPLRDHIFFLAQLQNLGYLAAYFTALWWRSRSRQVTPAMLRVDKWPLVAVGACEAVAQLLFMVGAAQLPGQLLPLVNQTYLVWSLVFASLILGTRYSRAQLLGAALVLAGVCAAAIQPTALAHLIPQLGVKVPAVGPGMAAGVAATVELRYVGICIACFAFPAIANCIKERVFRSFASAHGRPLDIFVVNSFGSLFQAFFVVLLLPVTTALKGIALADLPAHLAASLRVFTGATATGAGGGAAAQGWLPYAVPLLASSYVAMNLVFNISILTLLRSVGSVTTTLVASSLVPLTIAAFTLPLPYLEPAILGPNFVVGASLLMAGLVTYNGDSWRALLGKSASR
ncbi:hypothetical protein Vafri_1463 [Volvox africanus]|nr:hypothetical protein Vafri_1463 [Volvox africanus]